MKNNFYNSEEIRKAEKLFNSLGIPCYVKIPAVDEKFGAKYTLVIGDELTNCTISQWSHERWHRDEFLYYAEGETINEISIPIGQACGEAISYYREKFSKRLPPEQLHRLKRAALDMLMDSRL